GEDGPARLEGPRPAAAVPGRDSALHASRPDRDDDVEVTAAELGVDERSRKRQRARRCSFIGRDEADVLGTRPRSDGPRRACERVEVALDRLAVERPRPVTALEDEAVRHADEAGDVLARGLLEGLL